MDNYFLSGYISVDTKDQIVQVQFDNLIKFIKLGENVYMLNDLNKAYNEFFNEDNEHSTDEKNTRHIEMFKSYLFKNLKTYNHNKLVEQLFNLLDDTGYSYVYYDNVGMERKYKNGKYIGY